MAIGRRDDQTIHEYLLNADQYLGELKEVAKAIKAEARTEKDLDLIRKQLGIETDKLAGQTEKLTQKVEQNINQNKGMIRGLHDIKAGFDMVYRSAKVVASAIDDVLSTGQKYQNLLAFNTISIGQAQVATRGLVSEIDLLIAANTAAEFKLGLTAEQFAVFAKGAVVQSQKLGIDANKAMQDLILGTSRGSKKILDNLGLIVREGATVSDVVAELNRKVGEQEIAVGGAGTAWTQLKVQVGDYVVQAKAAIAADEKLASDMKAFGDLLAFVSGNYRDLQKESIGAIKPMAEFFDRYGSMLGIFGTLVQRLGIAGTVSRELGQADFMNRLAAAKEYTVDIPSEAALYGGPLRGSATEKEERKVGALSTKGGKLTEPQSLFWENFLGDPAGYVGRKLQGLAAEGLEGFGEEFGGERKGMTVEETRGGWGDISGQWQQMQQQTEAMWALEDAARNAADAYDALSSVQKSWAEDTKGMALGAVKDLATGMVMSVDALIMGTESFGMSMLKLVKATAFGVMGEAAAHALKMAGFAMEFSTFAAMPIVGSFWVTPAALAWASVAKWAAIAGGAGAVGLVSSAAISASGGGGGGAGQGAFGGGANSSYRPTFGQKKESTQPITIYVQIGDHDNPSATVLATKQIEAQLKMAA